MERISRIPKQISDDPPQKTRIAPHEPLDPTEL